ncbi:MAG: hypothetical protein IRZ15_16625 [Bryobacteraceae bacterium]|nr:hypothetical protein [Bryobacteraceae bacterium]
MNLIRAARMIGTALAIVARAVAPAGKPKASNSVPSGLPLARVSSGIPFLIKIAYAGFIAVLAPVYVRHYGAANLLWFSNIGLLGGLAAVWSGSRWLASSQAVSLSFSEFIWILDFAFAQVLHRSPTGITAYMFDRKIPRFIRSLSLYHLVLPFLLLWLAHRLGYERRAWIAQTLLAWAVLLITYRFTSPERNINLVWGPGTRPQRKVPPLLYLIVEMAVWPAAVYFPSHVLLTRLYTRFDRLAQLPRQS